MDLIDTRNRAVSSDLTTHSLLATLTYNFGRDEHVDVAPIPAAPQPFAPPPPPPPPLAQPVVPCSQGPYIVFFDWDKADISAEAGSILNSAISAYGNCGTAAIMLAGHADRSGAAKYNVGLAQRRNASVQSYLTGRGIPATRISAQGFGETLPRVPTADGVREPQNRRVEVSYGPGAGR